MSVQADLVTFVEQWDLTGDLSTYAAAIGQMFLEVESYAADTDTVVGWQPLWDYTIAPHNALPWICMMVGETPPASATDAQLRSLIRANPNAYRGTPNSIIAAVKQCLTGSQLVGFAERTKGDGSADPDSISVFTYAAQTPNANAVLAALRRTVPADINVYYQDLTAPTWAALEAGISNGNWTLFESTYGPDWTNVEGQTPTYIIH